MLRWCSISCRTRVASAFRGINDPLQKTNDDLQVTNDKLEIEIGKLTGHPGDGLKLALHEAWVVADKLEATISKALKDLEEVQKKEGISALSAFFTGRAPTADDQSEVKRFTDLMAKIDAAGQAGVRAAKSKEDAAAAQDAWNKKALDALDEEIKKFETLTAQTQKLQDLHTGKGNAPTWLEYQQHPEKYNGYNTANGHPDQSVKLNEQQGTLETLRALRDRYSLSADEATMQGKLPGLTAAAEAAKKAAEEEKKQREEAARLAKAEREDWNRLIEQRARAKEEYLSGIEKINAEEAEAARSLLQILKEVRDLYPDGVQHAGEGQSANQWEGRLHEFSAAEHGIDERRRRAVIVGELAL